MLRWILALAGLANLLTLAWAFGWLGSRPDAGEHEPGRLTRQVAPQALTVLPDAFGTIAQPPEGALADGHPAADPADACREIGPLENAPALAAAHAAAEILPTGSWTMATRMEPAVWAVYEGRLTDSAAAQRQRSALAARGIVAELVVDRPEYLPGLTLGLFRQRADAERLVAGLSARGEKSVQVVPWAREPIGQVLRVSTASADVAPLLDRVVETAGLPPAHACR